MDPLKMYFLLNMGIFHCHVGLPDSIDPPHEQSSPKTTHLTSFYIKGLELCSAGEGALADMCLEAETPLEMGESGIQPTLP